MNINFKKLHPNAVVPTFGRSGDAGADLVATTITYTDSYIEYGTGIAIELPPGFAGLIFPRSSLSNYDLILTNHVGLLDSNYRGEIKFRFKATDPFPRVNPTLYKIGDRIGQLVVQQVPAVQFVEVEELSETNRGENGYGSSGK